MTIIQAEVPIYLKSEKHNLHFGAAYLTHKKQQNDVRLVISPLAIPTPCSIHLIRYAPRLMDSHDNLRFAFKWIVDAIADKLIPGLQPGQADASDKLTWSYEQVKSNDKKIEIIFEF